MAISCPPRQGYRCLHQLDYNNSCIEEHPDYETGKKECVIVRSTVDRKIVWQLHVDLFRAVREQATRYRGTIVLQCRRIAAA